MNIEYDKTTLEATETRTDGTRREVRITKGHIRVDIGNIGALTKAIHSLIDKITGFWG